MCFLCHFAYFMCLSKTSKKNIGGHRKKFCTNGQKWVISVTYVIPQREISVFKSLFVTLISQQTRSWLSLTGKVFATFGLITYCLLSLAITVLSRSCCPLSWSLCLFYQMTMSLQELVAPEAVTVRRSTFKRWKNLFHMWLINPPPPKNSQPGS